MKVNKNQVQASITQVHQWAGPIPAPESLIKYNDAVPNAAERIISMAEKEMEHRHQKEDIVIEQNRTQQKREWKLAITSTLLGFICVIILSTLIGYALYIGSNGIALGTAIGAIAAVAGLFTLGQIQKNKKE